MKNSKKESSALAFGLKCDFRTYSFLSELAEKLEDLRRYYEELCSSDETEEKDFQYLADQMTYLENRLEGEIHTIYGVNLTEIEKWH